MKTSDNFKAVQTKVTSCSKFFEDFVTSEFPGIMNFQPATKKPKLDVIQSSSGSSSSRNSPASDTKEKQSLLDELWGDDWSEDVIESCVQLETQICSQLHTTQVINVEQTQNAVRTSGKTGKQQNSKELPDGYSGRFVNNIPSRSSFRVPLRRTASGGDWSKSICNGTQYSNFQAVSLSPENNNKIKDKDSSALSSKFENLSLEYKKLQERYQVKEGEASLLRTHLLSTQNEIEKQKHDKLNEIESIKKTMQASIDNLTREIDSLKTQLQFKSMEAEAIATKNQQIHVGNRVLPESPVPRHKVLSNCFDRSQLPETTVAHREPLDKQNVNGDSDGKLLDLSHVKKWVSVHSCHSLHHLITPNVFHNSKLEPNYLDPPRSVYKPSLLSDLIDDECQGNEVKNMPSPQPSTSKTLVDFNVSKESKKDSHSVCRQSGQSISVRRRRKELHSHISTLEDSHLHLMELVNLTDLDSDHALQLIEQVILSSTSVLWELQNRLIDADRQKNFIEREKELLLAGYTYTPLTEEYILLDNKPWYRNEQGIEARRALGLLSALIQTAKHAVCLVLPPLVSGTASSDLCGGMYKQHELDDENSNSKLKNLSAVTNRCDNDRPFKKFKLSNDSINSDDKGKHKPSDLLNIIKNIVEYIGKQRRTLMFEGVLAGVTAFVTSLLQSETELSQDTQKEITKIVEQIVFSRPGPTVLLKVFHLLLAAIHCSTITNSLCHNSGDKTCLEGYTHVTFTPDTCTMQVLCLLVRLVPADRRFLITDVYTAWLLSVFIANGDGPSWLYSDPSKTTCQCRPNVSQLALILLGEACNVYNGKGAEEYKEVLERILQRGIFLIHKLLYKDEHFVVNAGDCEGYYELFLHAGSTFEPPIHLHQASKEVLENLCQQEAVRQPLHIVDAQNEDVQSVLSSLYDTPNEDFMEND